MKHTIIAAALVSMVMAVPAFAANSGSTSNSLTNPQGQSFEERQTNILNTIDERIASLQELKTCVQGASNDEDLKACRQKEMAEMQAKHPMMGSQRGMPGKP